MHAAGGAPHPRSRRGERQLSWLDALRAPGDGLAHSLADLETPAVFVTAVFGLIVGSYLNVIIARLPHRRSTIAPASHCPHCGSKIAPRDNIPVVSYVLLRGRCRYCKERISVRYPVVELITASLLAASVARFGLSFSALAAAALCCLAVVLAFIDAEHLLLPNRLTYGGIVVGLVFSPLVPWTTPLQSLIGALVGAAILLAMIGLWLIARRRWAMGLGDPKMLAMVGAFLGLRGVAVTLFFASALGTLVGVALLATRRVRWQSKLPYGVFLAIGSLISLFFGQSLVDWYLGLLV